MQAEAHQRGRDVETHIWRQLSKLIHRDSKLSQVSHQLERLDYHRYYLAVSQMRLYCLASHE